MPEMTPLYPKGASQYPATPLMSGERVAVYAAALAVAPISTYRTAVLLLAMVAPARLALAASRVTLVALLGTLVGVAALGL